MSVWVCFSCAPRKFTAYIVVRTAARFRRPRLAVRPLSCVDGFVIHMCSSSLCQRGSFWKRCTQKLIAERRQ